MLLRSWAGSGAQLGICGQLLFPCLDEWGLLHDGAVGLSTASRCDLRYRTVLEPVADRRLCGPGGARRLRGAVRAGRPAFERAGSVHGVRVRGDAAHARGPGGCARCRCCAGLCRGVRHRLLHRALRYRLGPGVRPAGYRPGRTCHSACRSLGAAAGPSRVLRPGGLAGGCVPGGGARAHPDVPAGGASPGWAGAESGYGRAGCGEGQDAVGCPPASRPTLYGRAVRTVRGCGSGRVRRL